MKSIITILAVLLSINIFAQRSPSDKLFEKMATQKGLTSLSFSKEMLDAIDLNVDNEDGTKENNITGDLNQVKLLIYEAPEDGSGINFREVALKYLPLSQFKEIDNDEYDINSENGTINIRVLNSGRKVKECHVLFEGETNSILLSFFGDFKVEDVKSLAHKVDDYK